ncbi:MAG TPA: cell wall-binding repeat-containing protein [Acidothermaceae bacterium]
MHGTHSTARPRGRVALAAAVTTVFSSVLLADASPATATPGYTYAVTAVSVGAHPSAVAVNPATDTIYVTQDGGSVSVIDGATNAVTPVAVGLAPSAIAADPGTDMVYVVNGGGDSVSVIDGHPNTVTTNTVITTVTVGANPDAVAIDPSTGMLYVVNSGGDSVSVIDGDPSSVTANMVIATVPVGANPDAVAVHPGTHRVYVVNSGGDSVSVIDGDPTTVTANMVIATVPVGGSPSALAVNVATAAVYVANYGDNTASVIDGNPSTSTTNTVIATVPVGSHPAALAIDQGTDQAYVVNSGGNTVSVIDGDKNTATSVVVGATPHAVAVNLVAASVYVANYGDSTVSVIARVALTPTTAPAPTSPVVSRVAGTDRYATAVAASTTQFPTAGAGAVVLANGTTYADALVGVPLAAAKNAPLLLTAGTTLPDATRAEITRVLPAGRTVYVLGGAAAIPTSITLQLNALGYPVDRLGGTDRYATAVAVADALGNPATTLLASGRDYPDALTTGPAAAKTGGAVLLTTGDALGVATSAYLAAHPGTIYAVGGPAAHADPAATPLVGADRYATAAVVAARFFPSPSHVGVATGANYPDALTGGALLGASGGPVLLADTAHTGAATTYLSQIRVGLDTCWVFGGGNAIPSSIVDTLTATLHE